MIAAAAALVLAATPPSGDPPRVLWRQGARSVWAEPCARQRGPDPDCTTLKLRTPGAPPVLLGSDYQPLRFGGAKVLWRDGSARRGPNVVVLGDHGGSAGCLDVFAIGSAGGQARVQRLTTCHGGASPVVLRRGRAGFDVRLDLLNFETTADAFTPGASVPVRWDGERFSLDLAAVRAERFDANDRELRRAAAFWCLQAFVTGPVGYDAVQPATLALLGLMLAGRADEAHAMLRATWPVAVTEVGGAVSAPQAPGLDAYWADLCAALTADPLWRELDLGHLPHADVILSGAAAAAAKRR